ncbi:hypothetical protein [Streptomyces sp. BK239]|uniref:hypothetical protein n=1 Tax=Streptomyces sp. BK239 TaxID=2512155 RepID=UPI00102AB004|nr:hypothetical protein [Streptomyces sp. BK239]RZU17979.1 hypothetical protein EV567_2899 [Streptomyces sp. BK239]
MDHVVNGLAVNPALPDELTDRLIEIADADLADRLADREDLSRAQAVALLSRVDDGGVSLAYGGRLTAADVDPLQQPHAALALLDQELGHPEWARLFAADPDVSVREKLAACPGLPPDVTERLAADPDVGVVVELALWTREPGVAAPLAAHPHTEVRRAVAANEVTPPAVLAALLHGEGLPPAEQCPVCDRGNAPGARDPDGPCPDGPCPADRDTPPDACCHGSHVSASHDVRRAALANPATPAEAAAGFAGHPGHRLRRALAAHPGLPAEAARRLAADPDPGVRADLARNPAADETSMRRLAEDEDRDVRRSLALSPRVPLDVLVSLAGAARIASTLLPRIALASPGEVGRLAASPDAAARMIVAQRRDLPAAVRDALAADPDAKVVKSVAPHPGLSEELLRAMVDRHGVHVVTPAALNPDASAALLETLARHEPPVRTALRVIARHPRAGAPALLACLTDRRARPLAAAHPALPPHVVTELLSDPDESVAEAAAANPALPLTVMRSLIP